MRPIRAHDPEREIVLLLEPYSYGLRGASPISAAWSAVPTTCARPGSSSWTTPTCPSMSRHIGRGTTVVQVWQRSDRLKRFGRARHPARAEAGADLPPSPLRLRRGVLGEPSRAAYATALRTPLERSVPLGCPAHGPVLRRDGVGGALGSGPSCPPSRARRDRTVVASCADLPRSGRDKSAATGFDAVRLRAALPTPTRWCSRRIRTSTRGRTPTDRV